MITALGVPRSEQISQNPYILQDQIRKFDDFGYGILPSQPSEVIDKDICYPQKQMQVVNYNIS